MWNCKYEQHFRNLKTVYSVSEQRELVAQAYLSVVVQWN